MRMLPRLLVMISFFVSPATLAAEESELPECAHNREAILALELVAFDQTEGAGWRPLYRAGCYVEAAELLRDWRSRHGEVNPIIPFHEAQLWAYGGRVDRALPLFERGFREGDSTGTVAWNLYVEGNLAFLQRDRARLEAATAKLAALPAPPNWGNAVTADGKPIRMAWPLNLNVMEALLRCWDETYEVAAHCHIPGWRPPGGAGQT